jgi:CRISPR-associated endonuclease/helicase Cas3
MTYDEIFAQATGRAPYPYQRRLALTDGLPVALSAPTGAGKTAAAALAWLYRRRFAAEAVRRVTARRLVFCLPMRTLVSQTAEVISIWLGRLALLDEGTGLGRGEGVSVHLLMGGDRDIDWHLHPERDAVLVGTQDMLLSRVLNRGYGMSRFLWPWHYALLSNDCFWVFDEVQLMSVGLATGLQLASFRKSFGGFGPTHSLFMSATMEPGWLETVDHPAPVSVFTLEADDLAAPDLSRRRQAKKKLERAKTVLARADKSAPAKLADEILDRHLPGSRTLAVFNTVDRALEVFDALERKAGTRNLASVLLHSRFRPPDREAAFTRAIAADFDGIVVSTQVIEAGVDITSSTLFTELAPWASLVQRAGRCNRGGESDEATVVWVDHEEEDPRSAAPYDAADLKAARRHLEALESFNPEAIARAGVAMPFASPAHVLRRRDAIDLFDTTADLGGADLDISRFIREGEERDAQVFYRDVEDAPTPDEPRPAREELCSVPFLALRDWLLAPRRAFRWDALDGLWRSVRDPEIVPGGIYLLRARDGGYDASRGWNGTFGPTSVVTRKAPPGEHDREEAMGEDPLSDLAGWVTLATHATDARRAAEEICSALDFLPPALADTLVRAARAHDLGKAHEVFQQTMKSGYTGSDPGPFAKSGGRAHHARAGFRHELASALGWLARGEGDDRDLVAYLLAAHHGKVRLSLRALPKDAAPSDPDRLHARGIWHGDALPEVDLGDGVVVPATTLSLTPMRMGRHDGAPSWVERVIALRERFGPFRLAYLEALVRAADVRASMREREAAL